MVLAIEPTAVKMDRAARGVPEVPPGLRRRADPAARDLGVGRVRRPRGATAEKGKRILDALTERAWNVMEPFMAGLAAG